MTKFLLGKLAIEVINHPPEQTLLTWLREQAYLTGTKEGCAEGDCGACTVAVGEMLEGRWVYRPINSCISFLADLEGRQILTVEELSAPSDGSLGSAQVLHPVQAAMVDLHGSQCGFCTPGFVMSLFCLHEAQEARETRGDGEGRQDGNGRLGRQEIDRALAGNLCRCTGYGPILQAAKVACNPQNAQGTQNTQDTRPTWIQEQREAGRDFVVRHKALKQPTKDVFRPQTLDELLTLRRDQPGSVLVGGATDIGLWVTKGRRKFPSLILMNGVKELSFIRENSGENGESNSLQIGAGITVEESIPHLSKRVSGLQPILERFGSRQVRSRGTVCGNLANGSPIGDLAPCFIAIGATVELASCDGRRRVPLEDFFIAYGKQDLKLNEIVHSFHLHGRNVPDFRAFKISKRYEQDISSLLLAFCPTWQEDLGHDRIFNHVRIACGGMAATPKRAQKTEQVFAGMALRDAIADLMRSQKTAKVAGKAEFSRIRQAMAKDFQPIADLRASSIYRTQVASNLLLKACISLQHAEGDKDFPALYPALYPASVGLGRSQST